MIYALAFGAAFIFVLLKAFQQLNVVHHQVWWIMPVSFGMAFCEVYVVANVASAGWGLIVLPIGFGSGLGCLSAMYLHRRYR
jgi:hypothetical protein